MASSNVMLAGQLPDTDDSQNSLSNADVVEIRRFAEGKTRIVDLTESLSCKPSIDPFDGFVRVDGHEDAKVIPTVEVISTAWRDLEEKLNLVMEWQDERDDIETEAMQFEVGDMERLRKVAKAATEREMSPADTDLIEITIQTLVALDTLLRLLKSRREALDLLQGRLRWEERRKDCWTTYVSLSNELDEFIRQARWSPQIYQKTAAGANESTFEADESNLPGTSTSEWSPITTRSANGLTTASHAKRQAIKVKTQSIALQSRCRSFVDEVVPLAGKQLDELIEQRQLPEAFLDEQDRLEDLAESIKDAEVFMIQLSIQWRKSDDIFRELRSLHIQGKKLTAALTSAQQEIPTEERLTGFYGQRDSLKQKLEAICGLQSASAFISDPRTSTHMLIDSLHQYLPEPTCETWPDQEGYTEQAKKVLATEMTSAAKHVRSACLSTDKYERGLHLYRKSRDHISQLKQATANLQSMKKRVSQGWIDESDFATLTLNSASSIDDSSRDGTAPDLTSVDCLDIHKHSLYVEAFPALLEEIRNLDQEAHRNIHDVEQVVRECIRDGLPHPLYRRDVDKATQDVKRAQSEARAVLDEAALSLKLLQKTRAIKLQTEQLKEDCQKCLEAETKAIVLALDVTSETSNSSLAADIQMQVDTLARRAKETGGTIQLLLKDLEEKNATSLGSALLDRNRAVLESVKMVQDNSNWLQSMIKQHCQLTALKDEHARLDQVGWELKARLGEKKEEMSCMLHLPGEDTDSATPARPASLPLSEKDAICKAIQQYVSATHSDVVLCGLPPNSLLDAYNRLEEIAAFPDPDQTARASVNEWCSLLSSLTEEIEIAWQDAQQRQLTSKQELDNLTAQQPVLDVELSTFEVILKEAQAICDAVEEERPDVPGQHTLESVQDTLHQALQRLDDVAKKGLCSSSLTSHLKKGRGEVLSIVDRAQSLQRRQEEQIQSRSAEVEADSLQSVTMAVTSEPTLASDGIPPIILAEGDIEPAIMHPIETSDDGKKEETKITGNAASDPIVPTSYVERDNGKQEDSKQANFELEDLKQRSDPLPMPLKHAQRNLADVVEDVFGSVPFKETFSMPEIKKAKPPARDVRTKMRDFIVSCADGVVEEQTQANGKAQFKTGLALPTIEAAEAVQREWKEIKSTAEKIAGQPGLLPATEADQVLLTLQVREAKVRRYAQLAAFAAKQSTTEEMLSKFLDVLDQSGEKDVKDKVQESLVEVIQSLSQATSAAEPVLTDFRVRHQLSQLRHSYQDMAAMATEVCNPPEEREDQDDTRSTCPSRSSSASSLPSLSGSISDGESVLGEQRQRQPVSLLRGPSTEEVVFAVPETPLASRARKQSSSSGSFATAPQSTPRQSIDRRVVSEGVTRATPSRLPIPKSWSNMEITTPKGVPRTTSNASLASIVTRTPASSSSSYGHRTRSRSDSGSLHGTRLPTRSPSGASLSNRGSTPQRVSSSSSSKPNQYRANPKSKLDVAVGKIVNKLPMPVKITHASVSGGGPSSANSTCSSAKEQWHDESGRYWVGQPDPKLCFCRILRSRTVMVRIGGGWQELGTYILKHFSHLGNDGNLSVAASPNVSPQIDRARMDKLPWISSTTLQNSLQTPTGKTGSAEMAKMSPESAYLTPVHERDEQGGSASFRSSRGGSASLTSSPVLLSKQFEKTSRNAEEMHGMWIRRERKTSLTGNTNTTMRSASLSQAKEVERDHHTRSTLASRNRNVSSSERFIGLQQRRRVESMSGGKKDESGGTIRTLPLLPRFRAESINLATTTRPTRQDPVLSRFSPALS